MSTGAHLPLCHAIKLLEDSGKITKDDVMEKSIKGNIFEELFNTNQAGSRWISIDDLDKFYTSKGILSNLNMIRIHVQEVDIHFNKSTKRFETIVAFTDGEITTDDRIDMGKTFIGWASFIPSPIGLVATGISVGIAIYDATHTAP